MSTPRLEQIMIRNYSNVFRQMLLSAFKSDPELTTQFSSEPVERQREIEEEVTRRSEEMARFLVNNIRQKGYLSEDPTDDKLEALIKETLQHFGVKQ